MGVVATLGAGKINRVAAQCDGSHQRGRTAVGNVDRVPVEFGLAKSVAGAEEMVSDMLAHF